MVKLPEKKETTVNRIYASWERKRKDEAAAKSKPWNGKGWREHLGGSMIGRECERQIWLSWRWSLPVQFPGRILRLFDTGHREEFRFIEELRRIGVEVIEGPPPGPGEKQRQFRVSDFVGHVGGSLDSVLMGLVEAPNSPHLGEFKTGNLKSYKAMSHEEPDKAGVINNKPEHYGQMQFYMGQWNKWINELSKRAIVEAENFFEGATVEELLALKIGRIERSFYLFRCKDNERLHSERLTFRPKVFANLRSRAERILTTPTAPERISKSPTFYKCKWCDFKTVCHPEHKDAQFPSKNCRTCIHSRPNLDETDGEHAQWLCGLDWAEPIDGPKAQFFGCPHHLFRPDMVGLEFDKVDESSRPKFAAYRLRDGRKLINVTKAGLNDFRTYAARLEFDGGLTPDEVREKLNADQAMGTSADLAEKPIQAVSGKAFLSEQWLQLTEKDQ